MRSLWVAVQFLTRIPLSAEGATEKEIGRSAVFFPIVGGLIGGVLLGAYLLFSAFLPFLAARVLTLVVLILFSGAFHLDGLADTIDGVYGGKDRDHALRIMRDPQVGAMGVIAIVTVLLLKTAVLASLSEEFFRGGILAAPVIGRGSMVMVLAFPYARPSGLGKTFADQRSKRDWPLALSLMIVAAFSVLKFAGICALLGALGGLGILLRVVWRKIHGVTGDVCGAANEVAETVFLLVLLATSSLSFSAVEGILPEVFWRWRL